MLLSLMLPAALLASGPSIDPDLAAQYFGEAKTFADRDGGRLWGMRLDGPMLFVDPSTRDVVTNAPAPYEGFTKAGEVWTGKLPNEALIANTAITVKGESWSMVMWPLPAIKENRVGLMAHELFHRIQAKVGLPPDIVRNDHLDTESGRLWLQLELRALQQALAAQPKARTKFIQDALIFRGYRQRLCPGAKKSEDRMEVHEGMAEFTGVMMRGDADPLKSIAERLPAFSKRRSFPNSFAYETGPAYGLLLNGFEKPGWNRRLTVQSSLTDLLARRTRFQMPRDVRLAALAAAKSYDYEILAQSERERETVRAAKERDYRAALVNGPVLILPLAQMNFSYDPGGVFPLGADGTVYPESTVGDAWGKVVVKKGVRITPDFKQAILPAPKDGDPKNADGWTLELNPGWHLVPGPRKGDWTVANPPGTASLREAPEPSPRTRQKLKA